MVLLTCVAWSAEAAAGAGSELAFIGKRGVGGIKTFGFPKLARGEEGRYGDDPYTPHWRDEMERGRLAELKGAGFDFIRININPAPLFAAQPEAFARLLGEIDQATRSAVEAGLGVMLDLHIAEGDPVWGTEAVTAGADAPAFRRYTETAAAIARMASAYDPKQVAIELFNEPPNPCAWTDRSAWPAQLEAIHAEARRAAPRHTLVVSGACYAAIEGLLLLDGSRFDGDTMFAVHFYEPFLFTHQGYWEGVDAFIAHVAPLPYPADLSQREAVVARMEQRMVAAKFGWFERMKARRRVDAYFAEAPDGRAVAARFAEIRAWADRYGVSPDRIVISEFGAMKNIYGKKGAAPADRARWLSDVREAAERNGFAWSVWALTNTMGIVRGDLGGPLDPGALQALGLNDGRLNNDGLAQ
jgi:hypothetical protein